MLSADVQKRFHEDMQCSCEVLHRAVTLLEYNLALSGLVISFSCRAIMQDESSPTLVHEADSLMHEAVIRPAS